MDFTPGTEPETESGFQDSALQGCQFQVDQKLFNAALSWVSKVLPKTSPQPVLRAMVMEAKDDYLEISGYDFEISQVTRIPANVITPGKFGITGALLSSIVSKLSGEMIFASEEGGFLNLSQGSRSSYQFPIIDLSDYPQLPSLPALSGTVAADIFADAVSQVARAASTDPSLVTFMGVHMIFNAETITLAATDRYRLAIREIPWTPAPETDLASFGAGVSAIVPAKALTDAAKQAAGKGEGELQLHAGVGAEIGEQRLFGCRFSDYDMTVRKLEGEYPNFDDLIPKAYNQIAYVAISELYERVDRIALVASKSNNSMPQVILEFSGDEVQLKAGAADLGSGTETVSCDFSGDAARVTFNARYLLDGLNALNGDTAVFCFTDTTRPVVMCSEPEVRPERGENNQFAAPNSELIYLLMPVRAGSQG